MRATFLAAPFALALALQPSLATAQLQVEAQASKLQYSLRDLDPDDGLQAALRHNAVDLPYLVSTTRGYDGDRHGVVFHDELATRWNDEARVPLMLDFPPYAATFASTGGGESMDTVQGQAWVRLNNPEGGRSVFADAASLPGQFYFELSPMSSVTFTLDVSFGLVPGPQQWAVHQEAYAWAWLNAGPFSFPYEYEPVLDSVNAALPAQTFTDSLSVTLDNTDASAWKVGGVSFAVGAGGWLELSPVPEPGAAAMWLAGGLLAALARTVQARSISWRMRRRQRSSPAE